MPWLAHLKKYKKIQEAIGLEVTGNSALFKGDFKIVRNRPPNGTNEWELYNILEDPGETLNLADELPEKLEELVNDYINYSLANGVIELPPDYNWAEEMLKNTFKKAFFHFIVVGCDGNNNNNCNNCLYILEKNEKDSFVNFCDPMSWSDFFWKDILFFVLVQIAAPKDNVGPHQEIVWQQGPDFRTDSRPNIIVIVADDLGINDMTDYDNLDPSGTVNTQI